MSDEANHVDKDSCFVNYASVTSRSFAVSLIVEFLGETAKRVVGQSVNRDTITCSINCNAVVSDQCSPYSCSLALVALSR